MTIARVLLSGEARAGYIPSERVATYRELVRLHTQLADEAARYQNEIQASSGRALSGVHAGLCRSLLAQRALRASSAYPHAQAVA